MIVPRLSLIVAALALIALLVAACGGDSDDNSKPAGTPDDWEEFSAGAWRGWVDPDWQVVAVDSDNVNDPALAQQIPASSLNVAKQLISTTRIKAITYVFLKPGASSLQTISLLGCFKESESTADGKIVEKFSSLGVPAAIRGSALFDGVRWNVAQVDVDPEIGTIQVYPHKGDCYMTFTFTTERGNTDSVAEFVRFVQALKVDTSKLPK